VPSGGNISRTFFRLTHIFCLQGVQGLLIPHPVQATKRSRHLVTVELGPMLWNKIDQLAQSQHRTRANLCRIIIAQYIQCLTNDTKTHSRNAKP